VVDVYGEIRRQRSEDRGRRSASQRSARQRSEVSGSEVRRRRLEDRDQRSEIRGQKRG